MRRLSMMVVLALMTLPLTPRTAGAQDACATFAWPVERERQQFAAASKPEWPSGASIPQAPNEGFALRLEPAASAKLSRAPERPARHGGAFAGMGSIAGLKPGLYQISLSQDAWLDVVQDDAFARSAAHSSSRGCNGVRKSVRFHLGASPLVIQVSDVAEPVINVAITAVNETK
ncbi:MAG: hypothetical protein AB7K64_19790 [Variibacter sp.]